MTGRVFCLSVSLVTLLALSACGERVQKMESKASDTAAWSVSDAANPGFAAAGWKAGDKTAWEAQMRKRNQSQNDYAR